MQENLMSSSILGNAFSREDITVQSHYDRPNTITGGHKACQGCGEALAARCVIDAAYEATDGKIVLVNATGCLEVFSSVYPENSWNVPWIHSLFGNAPAVAAGVIAALEKQGQKNVRVIAQGGDGATADIGMGCLSGMFDRNDDVLYVCYDNQAYMNTGVQRSGATPPLARTATTLPNKIYLGNSEKTGKNVPQIAIAHGIPYVATASIGNIHDLEQKVVKAIRIRGAKYIHIHVPCPLGWGYPPAETIKIAKLAIQCGLFPLFEAENGRLVRSVPIDDQICVDDYLRIQKRFSHLYGKNATTDTVKILQNIANENVEKYGLKRDVADE
jgi:pyruvate ferredoxin oxidoreductase beta subunit